MSDRVHFELDGVASFTRVVKPIGNSAYAQIPIGYMGKTVMIIVLED